MKAQFCFVRNTGKWSPDVVIFHVFVGAARREQVRRQLLDCYAADCGYFFRQWDEDTDFWLIQKAKEVFPKSNFPLIRFKSVSIGIMEFYRMVVEGKIEDYERNSKFPKGHFRIITKFDTEILPPPTVDNVIHLPSRPKRKNLKSILGDEEVKAAISFALILILIMLDAIVSNLIGY